ncbi:hypothetical protein FOMPIDRAFT_147516 [Fomitopsis schrenkii]|uniref:Uncharacterized protein n=1 Tax=Fomitopsis schrenkii TaxID=2126942 RepID=S8EGZ7_FOMSC|nr:hypothetical protein FOMPIDRAFT_147516 [Fomitopsis schrenkii]
MVDITTGGEGTIEEVDEPIHEQQPNGDAPPYFHAPGLVAHYQTQHDHARDQQPHQWPHSFPYPQAPQPSPSPRPSRPQSQILQPTAAGLGYPLPQEAPAQDAVNILHQRHPFPHSLSSPQIPQNAVSPPSSPAAVRVTVPPPVRHPVSPHSPAWTDSGGVARRASSYVSAKPLLREGVSEMHYVRASESERGRAREGWGWGANREGFRRGAPRLHPYVMTFTSPIDLVDLSTPEELPGEIPSGRRSP